MKRCTVVISNYNYEEYVASAVESCLGQTEPCEIIVVDDASVDDSWSVLLPYASEPSVKLVRLQGNSGGNARGKNVGIVLSTTPYITCLDSDDMLLPHSLYDRTDFRRVDFVHGWTLRLKRIGSFEDVLNNKERWDKSFEMTARQQSLSTQEAKRWTWAIEGNTVLAPRGIYDRFGLYDETLKWKVSREMWWRWLSRGVKYRTINKYVAIYRQHAKSATKLATKGEGPKNLKLISQMFTRCKEQRQTITPKNTLMPVHYDAYSWIDEVIE